MGEERDGLGGRGRDGRGLWGGGADVCALWWVVNCSGAIGGIGRRDF